MVSKNILILNNQCIKFSFHLLFFKNIIKEKIIIRLQAKKASVIQLLIQVKLIVLSKITHLCLCRDDCFI